MSKASDSGKAFLDQVLAKLPESVRDKAQEIFTAPEAADALTLVGDGVLARSDYSKNLDDLRAKEQQIKDDYDKLNAWYEPRKALVDKYSSLSDVEKAIAAAKGDPILHRDDGNGNGNGKVGMSEEDLDKFLSKREEGYAAVVGVATTIATRHLRDFNEVLDVHDLIANATKKRTTIEAAYQEKFGEQIAAKQKKAEDDRISKLVEERLADERKKQADQPFPLRNASPSVLDVLESKEDAPSKHTIDTAVAEYERLQSISR